MRLGPIDLDEKGADEMTDVEVLGVKGVKRSAHLSYRCVCLCMCVCVCVYEFI